LKAAKVRLNEIKQHVERKFADEQSFILQRELKELNKQQLLRFHNLETQLTNNVCFLFGLTRVARIDRVGPKDESVHFIRSGIGYVSGQKKTRARFDKNEAEKTRTAVQLKSFPKNALTSACLDTGRPNYTFIF